MTGEEIKTFFEGIIDDTIDDDTAYMIMNAAKDKVELERDWEILKKFDTSQSASSAAKTLPTDFLSPIRLYVGNQPYFQIPFEQKPLFANASLRWFLDLASGTYTLLGANLSGVIQFCYKYSTPEITAQTSPVWPVKFHKRIAFEMAEMFSAIDQSERGSSWDDKWALQSKILTNLMIDWDESLKIRANENALGDDQFASEDIGMLG